MEEPQPLPGQTSSKLIPDPNTDFGNEAFDYASMPRERISFGGINDFIFSLMRPKKKPGILSRVPKTSAKIVAPAAPVEYMGPPFHPDNHLLPCHPPMTFNPHNDLDVPITIPPGFMVENGLLLRKKTLPERVAMQIRNSFLNHSSATIVRGLALAAFAIGALMIYAEIPTHPEIVAGIVLCVVAGNVLIANRG